MENDEHVKSENPDRKDIDSESPEETNTGDELEKTKSSDEDVIEENPETEEQDDFEEEQTSTPGPNVEVNVDLRSPEETKFACPFCYQEQDRKTFGKNICSNCGRTFIVRGEVKVDKYANLDEKETREFNKVLAHIDNKLRHKDYEGAYRYCLKAEVIAPDEFITWEKFVFTSFFIEITKNKNIRKRSVDIIRLINVHLDKCKDHGITNERYEALRIEIANRLFNIEKSRINSVKAQTYDQYNNPQWTKYNLRYISKFLHTEIRRNHLLNIDNNFKAIVKKGEEYIKFRIY